MYDDGSEISARFHYGRENGVVGSLAAGADAGAVEPVSTPKFPANREINREFFNFGLDRGTEVTIRPMIQRT